MIKRSSDKGFTLIELLFVILIIGILSAIVLANFGPAKQRARDAKRLSDVAQIQTALEAYFENPSNTVPGNGINSYPPSSANVKGDGTNSNTPLLPCQPYSVGDSAIGGLNCLTATNGNSNTSYLPTVPIDPSNNQYDYYSCDPGASDKSCRNTDLTNANQGFYQHYCVGANFENTSSQSSAVNTASFSCQNVTWCPYLSSYSGSVPAKKVPSDNYVICR
jgi:prepilin-type N-terminal cleavage/methylation domain-containing protein